MKKMENYPNLERKLFNAVQANIIPCLLIMSNDNFNNNWITLIFITIFFNFIVAYYTYGTLYIDNSKIIYRNFLYWPCRYLEIRIDEIDKIITGDARFNYEYIEFHMKEVKLYKIPLIYAPGIKFEEKFYILVENYNAFREKIR